MFHHSTILSFLLEVCGGAVSRGRGRKEIVEILPDVWGIHSYWPDKHFYGILEFTIIFGTS